MLKPTYYLLWTKLALSIPLGAVEEKFLFDKPEFEKFFLADRFPAPADEQQNVSDNLSPRHHYVFAGEMLYLKPSLDSMPWFSVYDDTENNSSALSTTTFSKQSSQLKQINLPYDFGFRIAMGLDATWMNLKILANWMRLHTHEDSSVPTLPVINFADPGINQPLFYRAFWTSEITHPTGQIYFANNHTNFHFDQVDLTTKVPLRAMRKLTLAPLIGVRAVIADFKTTINYFTTQYGSTDTTTPPFNENITEVKERFRAMGPVAGFDGNLSLGWGFHLNTLVDAALVFTDLKSFNQEQKIVPVQVGVQVPVVYNTSMKSLGFKPMIDVQLALTWNKGFWQDKMTLNFHMGYEAHFTPNFFDLIYFKSDSNTADTNVFYDLTLQGLNAGIGLSF